MNLEKKITLLKNLVLYGLISFIYLNLTVYLFSEILKINLNTNFEALSFYETIILVLILAPLIETLIFQYGIITLLKYLLRLSNINSKVTYYVTVFLSGVSFGLFHLYSIYYVLITTVAGWFWAVIYLKYLKQTKSSLMAFMSIIIIHLISNLLSMILSYAT